MSNFNYTLCQTDIVTFIYFECILSIVRGEKQTEQKRGEQSKDKNKVNCIKIISKKFKTVKNAREKTRARAGGGRRGTRAGATRTHVTQTREGKMLGENS